MNGAYDLEGIIYHQHSNKLMVKILELFDKEIPVKDFGCGHNWYVGVLNCAGYHAIGYDMIDINKSENENSNHPSFRKMDLSDPCLGIGFLGITNAISLEVGEHIPYDLCFNYLDKICSVQGDILLSWAVPGQAGIGHINCQTNEWVIEQMEKRNYKIDSEKTEQLRKAVNGCHCSWFVNTLMYFTPCE